RAKHKGIRQFENWLMHRPPACADMIRIPLVLFQKERQAKWAGVVKQFYSVLQGRHDLRVMPFPVSSVHPEG
ncbi:MAG: hypothetical protein IKH57_03990, partial [Clostridia bacterium]|nr:hypothetical protein [Clostridia bacterium]